MDRNLFDIPHHANLFALIYRGAVELYGEKGALAADEGTKIYGQQRGARMAQRATKDGAPLTMESYLLYGEWADKNGNTDVESNIYSDGHGTGTRAAGGTGPHASITDPVPCAGSQYLGYCEAMRFNRAGN